MAATASLRWEENLSRDKGKRTYLVVDATDIGDAYTCARTAAGATWMNLAQSDAHVDDIKPVGNTGEVIYFVSVEFSNPDAAGGRGKQTGDSTFSFDTTGGTTHISQAREHIATYNSGGSVSTEFDGAINVDKGVVKGVDIVTPKFRFSETHYISNASVDAAYKSVLYRLTGKVNDATFKGLAAGECLFVGARGSKRAQGDWEITFDFEGSQNLTSFDVGSITVAAAQGWYYVWATYEQIEDATNKALVSRPLYAHVERVYDADDFSDLGIGT